MSAAIQGSAEWLSERAGKLTASRMASAMSFLKNGKESAERAKLKLELLAERLTGDSVRHFVSEAMQWGIDHEEEARREFELATGLIAKPCGFFNHPTIEFFGGTPDSIIDPGAVLEIKCPTTTTHIQYALGTGVPEEYRPQIITQLLCTGRERAYFCSFDPRVQGPRRLVIREWVPTVEERQAVEDAARQFLAELDDLFERFTQEAA